MHPSLQLKKDSSLKYKKGRESDGHEWINQTQNKSINENVFVFIKTIIHSKQTVNNELNP